MDNDGGSFDWRKRPLREMKKPERVDAYNRLVAEIKRLGGDVMDEVVPDNVISSNLGKRITALRRQLDELETPNKGEHVSTSEGISTEEVTPIMSVLMRMRRERVISDERLRELMRIARIAGTAAAIATLKELLQKFSKEKINADSLRETEESIKKLSEKYPDELVNEAKVVMTPVVPPPKSKEKNNMNSEDRPPKRRWFRSAEGTPPSAPPSAPPQTPSNGGLGGNFLTNGWVQVAAVVVIVGTLILAAMWWSNRDDDDFVPTGTDTPVTTATPTTIPPTPAAGSGALSAVQVDEVRRIVEPVVTDMLKEMKIASQSDIDTATNRILTEVKEEIEKLRVASQPAGSPISDDRVKQIVRDVINETVVRTALAATGGSTEIDWTPPAPGSDLNNDNDFDKTHIELSKVDRWIHRVFDTRLFNEANSWGGADSWFVSLNKGPNSGGFWTDHGKFSSGEIVYRGTETHIAWCLGVLTTGQYKSEFFDGEDTNLPAAINVRIAPKSVVTVKTASGNSVSQATSDAGDITIIMPDSGVITICVDYTTAAPTHESLVWWGPYDRSENINTIDAR